MELRKLIMLGVAFVGVAGTTAVAISGQSAFTIPETFATGSNMNKLKTFDKDTALSVGAIDPYLPFNYYVDKTGDHSKIGIGLGNDNAATSQIDCDDAFYKSTYDGGLDEDVEGTLLIGLNNITDFSVTYEAGQNASFDFHLVTSGYDFLSSDSVSGPEVTSEGDAAYNTTTSGTFHFSTDHDTDGGKPAAGEYTGGDAMFLWITFCRDSHAFGDSLLNITSMTINWDC